MDANEFLKNITPNAKRSRLQPFLNDIKKLRESGCTLGQISAFLAANGVQISIAGLSKYIKRQEGARGGVERVGALSGVNIQDATPPILAGQERTQTTENRKIKNPADIRKARKREIDLDDFSQNNKE